MSFEKGSKFDSLAAFKTAKEEFEKKNNVVFVIQHSDLMSKKASAIQHETFRYKRIQYKCKFGGEAQSKGTGLRKTSTYKKKCPAFMVVNRQQEREQFSLVITEFNNEHQNHQVSCEEYALLPVNRQKIIAQNSEYLKDVTSVKGNMKLIQSQLNSKSERSVVTLKDLHNFASKNKEEQSETVKEFISELQNIPDSDVSIFVNDGNPIGEIDDTAQIESILFQDKRMRKNFELYPEVLMCDATYKVNDRNMPLFVMMVIDGNGETQIVGLVVLKSENNTAIQSALNAFKLKNEKHTLTKVSGVCFFNTNNTFV